MTVDVEAWLKRLAAQARAAREILRSTLGLAYRNSLPFYQHAKEAALEFHRGLFRGLDPGANLGLAIVVVSLVWELIGYLILTGHTAITPNEVVVVRVLTVNVILIVLMFALIGWQVHGLATAWRRQVPGARLHARIVLMFSLITALPAILLSIAATDSFSRSLDTFLNARAREIVEDSVNLANAYVAEHGQLLRTDLVNMAHDIEGMTELPSDPQALHDIVVAQAAARDLPFAYVIDRSGRIVVAGVEDPKIPFKAPSEDALAEADAGQTALMLAKDGSRVGALVKLSNPQGLYLFVARGMAPDVLDHLKRAAAGVAEFSELRKRRGGITLAQALIYATIALTGIMAAMWGGLWFANRFVAPIRRLIVAAQEVSRGNLNTALPVRRGEGDLRRLSQTFNTMTSELKSQRDALVAANDQLDQRRRVMEAVLSGVSAGVLGLDAEGTIRLANRSAETLLALPLESLIDHPLAKALPTFAPLISPQAEPRLKSRPVDQLTMTIGSEERTFAVRVTGEQATPGAGGAVITFDDISELVSAQRTSAWGDVARRLAHEIKNPLTPIQLSAERIRRKYGRVITDDRETFDKLTDTIERQAGYVKTLVDEFAAFARMPNPVMGLDDLRNAVQEAVVLQREGFPGIEFRWSGPPAPVRTRFDRRLVSQATTNIVKNAAEAIQQAAEQPDHPKDYKGVVEVTLKADDRLAVIEVIDNGIGLQSQNRTRLLEPYVTTKIKGTGLGLAIVKKIIEQHGGVLALEDAPPAPGRTRGALVRITLPIRKETEVPMAEVKPAAE